MRNNIVKKRESYRKILSSYIVGMLVFASFAVFIQTAEASGSNDVVTTYVTDGDSVTESTEFYDDDSVIVNVTMNNITGDPGGPPYTMIARNLNTSDWVLLPVSDNQDMAPGVTNIPGDGTYWGFFNTSSSGDSINATMGTDAVLVVSNGHVINITENETLDSSLLWDNDSDVAHILITINGGGGDTDPPTIVDNSPSMGYKNTSYTFNASVYDNAGVSSVWVDYNYNSIHHNYSMSSVGNSFYEVDITWGAVSEMVTFSILAKDTNNLWNETLDTVEVTDPCGGNSPPDVTSETPGNQNTDVSLGLPSLSVYISDPEDDSFDWSIETSPNINTGPSSGTSESNGTKTCNVMGLSLIHI